MAPPTLVLFDANQTLYDLEPVRRRMIDAGLDADMMETWFAEVLRDGFALAATGGFAPFPDIAKHHLSAALRHVRDDGTDVAVEQILHGFQEVTPQADVATAFRQLRASGVRVATLTNGTIEVVRGFLERAGLLDDVAATLAVAEANVWKPHPDAYRYALGALGAEASRTAMVAVHPWDTHGAGEAGLIAAWVNRHAAVYPSFMRAPDVEAASLAGAVEQLVSR